MVAETNEIYSKIDTNHCLLLNIPKEKILSYSTDCTKFEKDKTQFHIMDHTEPHVIRRNLILKDHPEIIELLVKKEPYKSMVFVWILNVIQFLTCFAIYYFEIPMTYVVLYALFIGAIFNHSLYILFHDITHFNCYKSTQMNQIAAIFCNISHLIPSAIAFGRYHKDHHNYQGDVERDPDLPCIAEIAFFTTRFRRLLYIIFMPLFYALRPYFKQAKPVSFWEVMNIIGVVSYAFLIYNLFTSKAVYYLLLCTWFGLSVHPVAAHVIAEHYEYFKSQDTFSYYGCLNFFNFNVGYHIEHHDFPSVPWYNLPEITRIAPEYYVTLPQVDSYVKVLYKYIFDGEIGPWSRIILKNKEN